MPRELVDLELILVRDNEKDQAILVKLDEDSKPVWLPRSEIEYRLSGRRMVTVTLPEWLGIDKELI